ncbi:MAG: hypothetical protein H6Q51_2261 [Deltaproteobacteria bacterium]|jgi:hypothetical protein|nr:hypothetical protein [Deltaproteobacteria bacterium]
MSVGLPVQFSTASITGQARELTRIKGLWQVGQGTDLC